MTQNPSGPQPPRPQGAPIPQGLPRPVVVPRPQGLQPAPAPAAHPAPSAPQHPAHQPSAVPYIPTPKAADETPLELVDETAAAPSASKIKSFGTRDMARHQDAYTRKTVVTGHGAARVRTFHGRLSDEGLVYLDDKINEWLNQNPDIEVKFVTTTVGQFEGKLKEPALIMNVWY